MRPVVGRFRHISGLFLLSSAMSRPKTDRAKPSLNLFPVRLNEEPTMQTILVSRLPTGVKSLRPAPTAISSRRHLLSQGAWSRWI